jgi:hypothetical protein
MFAYSQGIGAIRSNSFPMMVSGLMPSMIMYEIINTARMKITNSMRESIELYLRSDLYASEIGLLLRIVLLLKWLG